MNHLKRRRFRNDCARRLRKRNENYRENENLSQWTAVSAAYARPFLALAKRIYFLFPKLIQTNPMISKQELDEMDAINNELIDGPIMSEPDEDRMLAQGEYARRNELISDDDPQNELRRGAQTMNQFWLNAINILYGYRGNKAMAFDCFMVAIGEGPRIGLQSAVDISKKYCLTDDQKATATKCIQYFQKRCGIPPMPGQRDAAGCRAMAEARKGQLKKTTQENQAKQTP